MDSLTLFPSSFRSRRGAGRSRRGAGRSAVLAAALVFCTPLPVEAVDGEPVAPPLYIDVEWFRRTLLDDLSKILAAAPSASGAFHPRFNRRWQAEAGDVANAVG